MDRHWLYAALGIAAGIGVVRVLTKSRISPGKTRILVIGDSLGVGMAPPLKSLAADKQVQLVSIAKVSTRIDQWAQSQALIDKIAEFQPTLILVSLGTNDEYMVGDGGARQAPWLDKLLERLYQAGREVVWIGPPKLPKSKSNGVVPLILSKVPKSDYFHSETLDIPRGPDNLHPTAKGYAGWAGALWTWLN